MITLFILDLLIFAYLYKKYVYGVENYKFLADNKATKEVIFDVVMLIQVVFTTFGIIIFSVIYLP